MTMTLVLVLVVVAILAALVVVRMDSGIVVRTEEQARKAERIRQARYALYLVRKSGIRISERGRAGLQRLADGKLPLNGEQRNAIAGALAKLGH